MKYHVSNTDNPVDFPKTDQFREFERASGIEIYGLGKDRVKWEATLERYRELIVRECMEVVARKCASPTAYNALIEHFGVEE